MADYGVGEWLKAQFSVRCSDSRFSYPTGSSGDRFDPLDPNQYAETERVMASPRVEGQLFPWWKQVLQIGYNREKRISADPADVVVDDDDLAVVSDIQSRPENRPGASREGLQDGWCPRHRAFILFYHLFGRREAITPGRGMWEWAKTPRGRMGRNPMEPR